jgi:hypothetical protein
MTIRPASCACRTTVSSVESQRESNSFFSSISPNAAGAETSSDRKFSPALQHSRLLGARGNYAASQVFSISVSYASFPGLPSPISCCHWS